MKKILFLIFISFLAIGCGGSSGGSPADSALATNYFYVSYDANTGEGTVPSDTNEYKYQDSVIVKANTLSKSGFTFVKWNTFADGSGISYLPNDTLTIGTSSVTLYAIWTSSATYHVYYNASGITAEVPTDSNSYLSGSTVTLGTITTFTYPNYVFGGWTCDNGITILPAGASYTITGDVIFVAHWTNAPTYKVWYYDNGCYTGTAPVDSNNYYAGSSVTVLANSDLKHYYTRVTNDPSGTFTVNAIFTGWNTLANGTGTSYSAGDSVAITNNVILYAQWRNPVVGDLGDSGGIIVYDAGCFIRDSSNVLYRYVEMAPADVVGNPSSSTKVTFDDFVASLISTGTSYYGCKGWRLPTYMEASSIYSNRDQINVSPAFSNVYYWTNTLDSATTYRTMNFTTGNLYSWSPQVANIRARLVRYVDCSNM